ncbi:MAG: hypothetical protein ABIH66_06185 [bacterium]
MMKNFNILGSKGKGEGEELPKKGKAAPPSGKAGASRPPDKGKAGAKNGVLKPRAPKAPGEGKLRKPEASKEKKLREPKVTAGKGGKKLSPAMITGIVLLVLIVAGVLYMMRKPPQGRQQAATQPGMSAVQSARMEMKREEAEESPLKAGQPAVLEQKMEPQKEEKAEPSLLKPAGGIEKTRSVQVVKVGEKKTQKTDSPGTRVKLSEKPAPGTVAKPPAPKSGSSKVFVQPKKRPEEMRESLAVSPLGPTEPGYLPPEPGSPVEEELRRQTIFYMVLVEEADSKEELRKIAKSLELTMVAPEIREKSYGDSDVYWLTVGHYTRESDAYNMAQVIRRMGYIAEVVSEKVYH